MLRHGKPGQPEVVAARDWLIKARVIAPQERSDTRRASGDEAEPSAAATARVEGRVVSGSAGEPQPAKRQQLFLIDHPNRERRYPGRTDDEGRYVFPAVVPGIYKLTDRVVGDPAWRLRVEAKPGQVVFQDLGPSNTTKSRDDFPTQ